LPLIWDLAISLNPIVHGGKVVSAFGSYGWSGEGVDNIINRLDQLRMHVLEGFKIKFKPSEMNQNDAIEFGRLYAKCLLANEVPKRPTFTSVVPQDINPSGEVTSWRCIICGEIYEGVLPPEVCPACGVGAELFEHVDIDPITFTSTTNERFVIIGGGVAAVSAAEAIRARNTVGSITILSQESSLPYYRPLLSDTISQDVTDEEFYLHPENYYTEQNITVQLNTTVQSIDVDGQFISLENGETIAYDKLIMATGSQPFIPPFKGANLNGVFSIKYKKDADNLREFAKGKSKAVIVGGGVLGLEAADALLELGLHVSIVEGAPAIMPRQLDATASDLMLDILTQKGIDVHLGTTLKELVESNGSVSGVVLDNKTIDADLVVINVGVRANIALACEANIKTNRGIIVDQQMKTSISTIYACGDVVEYNDLNVSLWSPAIAQGKVAGANAAGDNLSFEPLAEPLSLIAFDTEVFSIGNYPTSNLDQYKIITDSNHSTHELKKLYFKDDQLVYGVLFNNMAKANVLLNGIRKGHTQQTVISNLFN
ncbi:MAG: FAD-dependent oxidoreductase, partial [Turicibacter sp.]